MTIGLLQFARSMLGSTSRVTLNAPAGYGFANIAKSFGFLVDPATSQDANGYPTVCPNPSLGSNPSMPANYWADFVWSWSGTASMSFSGVPPIIVSQSNITGTVPLGDQNPGNLALTSIANPRIQFKFAALIQSITNNGAGLIRVTLKTGYAANLPDGMSCNIVNTTTANGTFTLTRIAGNNDAFDLIGSTYVSNETTGGTITFRWSNASASLGNFTTPGGGTWSGFTNLVFCKVANEGIALTKVYDPDLLAQIKDLSNPSNLAAPNVWLRFMDYIGVQSNWEADFSQRQTLSKMSYRVDNLLPAYWVGTLSQTGDAYSAASNPTVAIWNGTNYIDNGIVQAKVTTANVGGFPTLSVGGGPAKPIFQYENGLGAYQYFATTNPINTTTAYTFRFQASWLNGGTALSISYTPVSADVADTSGFTFTRNLIYQFDADEATQAGLTPTAGSLLLKAAGITFGNPFNSIYPPTAQAGRLSFTQTAGTAGIVTIQTAYPGYVFGASDPTSQGRGTFMYNYLLDGWVYRPGGLIMSMPAEGIVEVCNATKAHAWICYGMHKSGFVSSLSTYLATNLSAGLRVGQEPFNEVWNNFAKPKAFINALGIALGFPKGSDYAPMTYAALRLIQYNEVAKTAWTAAGRVASDLWCIQPSAGYDVSAGGNFDVSQFMGIWLNRTGSSQSYFGGGIVVPNNTIYGTYGGLNGVGGSTAPVTINYNISPNRPVDITNMTGNAPYWSSAWLGNGGSVCAAVGNDPAGRGIQGTVAQNAVMLQPALDYANGGSVATAFAAQVNLFTQHVGAANPYHYDFSDMLVTFTNEEARCAQYDGSRPSGMAPLVISDYECGPSWGCGANGNNGINGAGLDDVPVSDLSALSTRMVELGWDVRPYTQSGNPAIVSGTYNNSTGLVVLTLASPLAYATAATITGSVSDLYNTAASGNFLFVTAVTGTIRKGQALSGSGVTGGTLISDQFSGTPGGVGIYYITTSFLTSSQAFATGDSITVSSLTGTGAFASLNGSFTTTATTGGTTVSYNAAAGLGASTITGGDLYDVTATNYEMAKILTRFWQGWKYDLTRTGAAAGTGSYKNMIKANYYAKRNNANTSREAHSAQFGYAPAGQWGFFANDYGQTPYTNYAAMHEFNA